MPNSPGIYKMIDADGKILYVGKAKELPKRVASYANYDKLTNRIKQMVSQINRIEYIITNSDAEAIILEANLIKNIKPPYNIILRDDKSFPYILFEDKHDFPRITKYRGNKSVKGTYFGPFASPTQVKTALIEIQKVFYIRPCTDSFFASRIRPCIQYDIKRCSAPCVGKITREDYKKSVSLAKDFLKGKGSEVHDKLISLMEEASKNMEYEKAANIRDRIKILNTIQAKNIFADLGDNDIDLISVAKKQDTACIQIYFIRGGKNYGNKSYYQDNTTDISESEILEIFILQFYQNNTPPERIIVSHTCANFELLRQDLSKKAEKYVKLSDNNSSNGRVIDLIDFALNNANDSLNKFLKDRLKHEADLEAVAKLFGIKDRIERIEVYDNSHISGSNAIGCMIVYTNNGFAKDQYRKFNIRSTSAPDDYEMLREVLTRRFKKLDTDQNNIPDLMLIDGGKGHLSVTMEVAEKLGYSHINTVCISKGPDRNAGREFFHTKDGKPFQLDARNKTLNFLQILRDEAHRYAIKSHRDSRSRELKHSSLELIPGIGAKRKLALLRHFGSLDAVIQASSSDLRTVRGISKAVAEKIFNYLHSHSQN
jgi:excinuclease ABC subunit C